MLLMIDNYDSFTYNLVQYLGELNVSTEVVRNDKITLDEIAALAPQKIMISPGPGAPEQAGISLALIERFAGKIPILGICLGHQCIGQYYGGRIVQAKRIMHGKVSRVLHDGSSLFTDIPSPFTATRYHSLVIEQSSLPSCLQMTAWTEVDGQLEEIMAIQHKTLPLYGVQFHPESIMSEHGHRLLANFIQRDDTDD
jgi:anthranilate synthase component 2